MPPVLCDPCALCGLSFYLTLSHGFHRAERTRGALRLKYQALSSSPAYPPLFRATRTIAGRSSRSLNLYPRCNSSST